MKDFDRFYKPNLLLSVCCTYVLKSRYMTELSYRNILPQLWLAVSSDEVIIYAYGSQPEIISLRFTRS